MPTFSTVTKLNQSSAREAKQRDAWKNT